MGKSLLLLELFALFAACLVSAATATTYLIKSDGTGDFPTIQAAVGAVQTGDIIELADGTFTGPGNRDISYLGKAITIRSRSGVPWQCVIDCQGSITEPHRAFVFSHNEGLSSALEGVTITNACAVWGGGIRCMGEGVSPRIAHCIFSGNRSPQSEGGGMCCESDASPLIIGCIFTGNSARMGGGLSVTNGWGVSGPTVTGCTFYENTAEFEGGGVRL